MRAWTVSVLFLSFLLACGRDRSSGAAPAADSGRAMPADTSTVGVISDTARAMPAPESTAARVDTAKNIARQPTGKKPAAPAQAEPRDTARAVSPPADTAAAAAGPPAAPAPATEASAPLRDEYHRAPVDTVSQEVYDGWKQFNLNCARCHGEDVQGTTIAPHLIVSLRPEGPVNTKEQFVQIVCAGRPEKGMPAWCALGMDMEKINQIYAYVKGRSDAKIHPGRPAVKAGG
jgi:mono/diheme cytochrome c family protein